MFNSKFKFLVSGIILGSILSAGITLFASNGIREAYFNNEIKVLNNGKATDINAVTIVTEENPSGSTYLPLRKTAELLGKGIEWDGETNTANIVEGTPGVTPSVNPTSLNSTVNLYLSEIILDGFEGHRFRAYKIDNKVYLSPQDFLTGMGKSDSCYNWDYKTKTLSFKTEKGELNNVPFLYIEDRILVEYEYYKNNVIPLL